MGAGIATLVAGVAPDRVERVVLLEGMGPMATPAAQAPEQLRRAIESDAALAGVNNRVFPDLATAVAARVRNSGLDPESARLLVERAVVTCAGGVRFTHDPRLRARSRIRLTEEQVQAFLRATPCPVLAVRATSGWPYPEELLASRGQAIANLRVAQVEGGHHVHLTHPERVAPLIRDFFTMWAARIQNPEFKIQNSGLRIEGFPSPESHMFS